MGGLDGPPIPPQRSDAPRHSRGTPRNYFASPGASTGPPYPPHARTRPGIAWHASKLFRVPGGLDGPPIPGARTRPGKAVAPLGSPLPAQVELARRALVGSIDPTARGEPDGGGQAAHALLDLARAL